MKNRKALSFISVVAIICIVMNILTMLSFAKSEGVEIFVSISSEGELALAQEKILVTDVDNDGALTINDAFTIAHRDFYDGTDGYITENTQWGLSLKKFWGVENGGSYGYYVNNNMSNGLTDVLEEGDYLYAFSYKDAEKWTDKYCFFDKNTVDAKANEEITVTLFKYEFDKDFNLLQKPVENAVIIIDGAETDIKTDKDGKAVVSFKKSGKYTVSAKSESEILTPAVLIISVPKNGWVFENDIWRYYVNDEAKTGWQKIGKKWYYFDDQGAMQTGWQKIKGKWYYLEKSGAMATGWKKVDGKWYYLDKSGAMATGWKKVDGKWYYLDKSGSMAAGWKKVDGKWYYLEKSGAMATGWKKLSGKWYYLDKSGAMVTGDKKIDGKKYSFNKSGVLMSK